MYSYPTMIFLKVKSSFHQTILQDYAYNKKPIQIQVHLKDFCNKMQKRAPLIFASDPYTQWCHLIQRHVEIGLKIKSLFYFAIL